MTKGNSIGMTKQGTTIVLALAVAGLAASGGYWLGARSGTGAATAEQPAAASAAAKKERKLLLYYRNPMGLPDTSPTPKKDPMGMDYIAVFEGGDDGEEASPGDHKLIKISTEKIQKLGVRVAAVELRTLEKIVRAVGRIEPDERRLYTIAPKFEGYVERLYVNTTGQAVTKGQPLFEVYSPELVSAQREYAIAAQGEQTMKHAEGAAQNSMKQLAEASLLRLRNWDISEEQVKSLSQSGETRHTLTFRSPVTGIVTEKKAIQGMRFMPGEALYQIADLSSVWVIADVFEQDIGQVKLGARARIKIAAFPGKNFAGRIDYVYPTLKAETRTVSVRVELANPGHLIKPAMFAEMELPVGDKMQVLTVPDSAVIDSGTRRIVLVQLKQGRFEPREVRLGARSDNYFEVLEGVKAGEQVVVAANFLIDAESNLNAVVAGMGDSTAPASKVSSPAAKPAAAGHHAEGKIEAIDAKAGTLTITHGPIESLKWPGMTMDFALANASLIGNLKPGATVAFNFVERKPGEWVIVKLDATDTEHPVVHAGSGH